MTIASISTVPQDALSLAWGDLLVRRMARGVGDIPATISITTFEDDGTATEDTDIRNALDGMIQELRLNDPKVNSVDVSGLVVFPYREWVRKGRPRHDLFAGHYRKRFGKWLARMDKRNKDGTYFLRFIDYTGTDKKGEIVSIDQIANIIGFWQHYTSIGKRPRQGAMQLTCLDPCKDITLKPRQVFPCLHQVGLTWNGDSLALNAYYATQYIASRAYGNYLGLCHLGAYFAHQLGMKLTRVNCFIGCAKLELNKSDPRLVAVADVIKKKIEGA